MNTPHTILLVWQLALFALLGLPSVFRGAAAESTMVRPDYANELRNSNDNRPADQSSSAAIFGGHIGEYRPPSFFRTALSFDGVDDYVLIRNFGWAAPNDEITVEFWLNTTGGRSQFAFGLYPDKIGNRFAASAPWGLGPHGTIIWDFGDIAGEGRLTYELPQSIARSWHHLAFTTYSQPGIAYYSFIYLDGVVVASKVWHGLVAPGPRDLIIGGLSPHEYFTLGQMDDFRVWNVYRSSEQVQASMHSQLTGKEPGLVAYWPFDEGSGHLVRDVTGHGYDGELMNGPSWVPGVNTQTNVPVMVPTDGTVRLAESSFGQPLASDNPFPDFSVTLARVAQAVLYPPPGTSREVLQNGPFPYDKPWAFRYKRLLYDSDAVAAEFEGDWFGPAERAQTDAALEVLRGGLFYAPWDRSLRHIYLDLFYDIGLAELQGLKNDLNTLARFRLDPDSLPEGTPVINAEIETYTNVLLRLEHTIAGYSRLLADPGGFDVATIDPTVPPGTPFGYYIFQKEQPFRNQYAAQFIDADGIVRTVPDLDPQTGNPLEPSSEPRVLAAGYKDYLFAITLLRDLVQQAAELARLYATRAQPEDIQAGYDLIAEFQQRIPADLAILEAIFPASSFPPDDPSGVRAAINGVGVALAELNHVRAFLDGNANPLGLNPDFLVLVKESLVGGSSNPNQPFDSYDALDAYLKTPLTGPLPVAQQTFLDARASYDNYRAKADTVDQELSDIEDVYGERHREITGYHPDDPEFSDFTGANPRPGSELWQSQQMVTNLQQRLSQLSAINDKILEQQEDAEQALQQSENKDHMIEEAVTMYSSRINSAYDTISEARQTMAIAQATADTMNNVGSSIAGASNVGAAVAGCIISAVAGAANGAAQATAEKDQAWAERDLDIASARFEADLTKVDVELNIIQARNNLHTVVREEMSNALEMREVVAQIEQEQAQQAALQRELEQIRQQRASSLSAVRNRYYADPVHFLRSRSAMLRAEHAFRRAQRWVFLTQRALEYKWNESFYYSYPLGGASFDRQAVFRARNYQELLDVVVALNDFNANKLLSFNRDWREDRISMRDDMLTPLGEGIVDEGWRYDGTNQVTKIELFRRMLSGQVLSPFVSQEAGYLVLKLNTFTLQKSGGTLFRGPEYDTNGVMRDLGAWLDKIDWVKLNVVTSNPPPEHATAKLSYGGTCYIRSETPPCFEGGLLPGAYTQFPFQFFFQDGPNWTSVPFQADGGLPLVYSSQSGEPTDDYKINFLKERSVAATDWRLTIRLDRLNLNEIQDIEIWIRHFVASTKPNLNCYEP